MQIKYLVNKIQYKVIFCPDREGLKIKKKKKSYTTVANDLLKIYNDKKILLIIDKKIGRRMEYHSVSDFRDSNPQKHSVPVVTTSREHSVLLKKAANKKRKEAK